MVAQPNAFQKGFQRFASLPPVAWAFRHTAHHLDRVAVKVFKGRTVSGMLAGIPNIMLTTTGAKSGEPRTVPLVGLPVGDGLAIIGTRFGSDQHPGWYHNLSKDPHAVVEQNGRRTEVVARRVPPGDEYDSIMAQADTVYAGYAKYRERITDREIPIFVLDPQGEPTEVPPPVSTGTASVVIARPPDEVWAAISDVTRIGEWSPECVAARWVGGATGPAVGASFEGDNVARVAGRTVKKWTTTSEVTVCEPGVAFGFVAEGYTTWRYDLSAEGACTRVTETFEYSPSGVQGFMYDTVMRRRGMMTKGMRATLQRLKTTLEA